ncbi:hypothetical protein B0G76_1306 [Paraburkholderia sp. BL23I1N1]|uniref:hypothetical protein n=1 Tax=Paraburkholderia sp. BL23I1N1 TaxID=1938802 RepID=UPI000E73DD0B|nr:hypothetical protein [Paraburkholderia sp. BL23I1N1]RKE35245.1 hypothetical protein B0G76_1306 [Paraburkholderia sp. BL23I1N1]
MKSIFIFDDTRSTDLRTSVLALGEDGQIVTGVRFDDACAPYAAYAMGAAHSFSGQEHAGIAEAVDYTRTCVLRRYDEVYGAGNWMPIWLDSPRAVPEWRHAMSIVRQRATAPMPSPAFGDTALKGILRDVMSGNAAPHGVTKH